MCLRYKRGGPSGPVAGSTWFFWCNLYTKLELFSLCYRSLPRLPSYLFYLSITLVCLQQVSKALVSYLSLALLTLKDLKNFLLLCTCVIFLDIWTQHPTSYHCDDTTAGYIQPSGPTTRPQASFLFLIAKHWVPSWWGEKEVLLAKSSSLHFLVERWIV